MSPGAGGEDTRHAGNGNKQQPRSGGEWMDGRKWNGRGTPQQVGQHFEGDVRRREALAGGATEEGIPPCRGIVASFQLKTQSELTHHWLSCFLSLATESFLDGQDVAFLYQLQ